MQPTKHNTSSSTDAGDGGTMAGRCGSTSKKSRWWLQHMVLPGCCQAMHWPSPKWLHLTEQTTGGGLLMAWPQPKAHRPHEGHATNLPHTTSFAIKQGKPPPCCQLWPSPQLDMVVCCFVRTCGLCTQGGCQEACNTPAGAWQGCGRGGGPAAVCKWCWHACVGGTNIPQSCRTQQQLPKGRGSRATTANVPTGGMLRVTLGMHCTTL